MQNYSLVNYPHLGYVKHIYHTPFPAHIHLIHEVKQKGAKKNIRHYRLQVKENSATYECSILSLAYTFV
jgi:hypothetical protein